MPALDSAPYLKPCPFCGCELDSKWNRANPSAKCATPECMGSKLPSLCLDVPEHIEAWNTRAEVTANHLCGQNSCAADVYRTLIAGRDTIQLSDEFLQEDAMTWLKDSLGIWVGAIYSHGLKPARRRV